MLFRYKMAIQRDWCVAVYLLTTFSASLQVSTPDSPNYIAAVVEYSPELYKQGSHPDRITKNAEQYVKLIEKAAYQNADIIVFPECGLAELQSSVQQSSEIPDPSYKIRPCESPIPVHEAVRTLSCAAWRNRMYVVVNIPEKEDCRKSPEDTCTVYYNTNVVFDRKGVIVARYRKFNLFGEPGFNVTEEPDLTVFDTDFGVTFGVFTCFDIIFEKPAVTLVKEMNITDIVFPTAWFSELPFLSAVQEQVAWAHSMDINFLGSGYNAPQGGSTGSGIYAGKGGVLASIMATSPTTELLVATVPKKNNRVENPQPSVRSLASTKTGSGILMLQDSLEPYNTLLLTKENIDNGIQKLCNDKLCCEFEVKMNLRNGDNVYQYRLVVFDGVRSFTFKTGGLQVCAVVFCSNDSLESCGLVRNNLDAFSTFEYINIKGNFRLSGVTLLPNTLLEGYNVMPQNSYSFELQENKVDDSVWVNMKTKVKMSSLFTFGIYGRDFKKDGLPATSVETTTLQSTSTMPPPTSVETTSSQDTTENKGENSVLLSLITIVFSTVMALFNNRQLLLNGIWM